MQTSSLCAGVAACLRAAGLRTAVFWLLASESKLEGVSRAAREHTIYSRVWECRGSDGERADLVGSWEVQHQGLSMWEGCMGFNDCGYSAGKQVGYPEGV